MSTKTLIHTIPGKLSSWRIYQDEEGIISAEIEFDIPEAKGTVLLDEWGYGLGFGVKERYQSDKEGSVDPMIGLIDLFYPANISNDPVRDNNPQIVISQPGADAICFVHLRPEGPVVSFENMVQQGKIGDTPVWGYFDHA